MVNWQNVVGYIGKAKEAQNRLAGHERLDEAMRKGYVRLFAYETRWSDPFYEDLEKDLIHKYSPPLNLHHNPMRSVAAALASRGTGIAGMFG
ncbi:hypothetical protein JP75_11505 [Devosia riboflavina]|uniref:GIY-YIG domain-containing protein n=1 Tax=Devosia riboflavina TaxID=46914 RepID=A0A087M270_9HYPH|nr:hypothetical protein JP75_11505 [Devosia riboflavina]